MFHPELARYERIDSWQSPRTRHKTQLEQLMEYFVIPKELLKADMGLWVDRPQRLPKAQRSKFKNFPD